MPIQKSALPRWMKVLLGFGILLLLAGGGWFYRDQEKMMREAAEQELKTITRFKVDQLVAWRQDQLGDAALLATNPLLVERATAFSANPKGAAEQELSTLLRQSQLEHDYADILLIDPEGRLLLSLSGNTHVLPEYQALLAEALEQGSPVFTPLHMDHERPSPHISVIAPLFTGGGGEQKLIGALLLIDNASDFLFPLIQSWPTPSKTAETLLVMREGDQVLFLNELRHQPAAALRLRIPLTSTNIAAVMAVLGVQGVVQGMDYRGIEVLAVLTPIPDSPWFMVTKVDVAEVFAGWRHRSFLILTLLLAVVMLLITTGLVAWQRHQKVYYRELYQAETALRESAERYTALAEDMPALICTFLPDSTLTYVNRAYADYFGVSPEQLIGRPFLDFIPADAAQEVRQAYLSLTPERPTHTYSHQAIKNGRKVWMEWTDRAFFDDRGIAVKFQAVGFDISERRRAEEALRESEDRYRDLVESSHDLISTHDLEGRILSVNARPTQVLGYSREELLRMNVRDLLVPEVRHKFDKYLDDIANLQEAQGTMHIQTRGGERRVWEYHSTLRTDAVGGPLVRSMAHDMTERLQAEEALRKSEALFKKLFEDHSAVKFIIDPDSGRVIDANEAAAKFYGWSREQLRQMKVEQINTLSPEEIRQAMAAVKSDQKGHFEFPHRLADGSIRTVEVFSSKIELEGRSVLHSIVHDITERKLAEAERERLMAAIEQAGEMVVITDAAGAIQYVNPAFENVTGYCRPEVLGKNPRILKSGRQDEAFYRDLWQTITSGRTWQGRFVNKRKDGSLFTEEATISPVRDPGGQTVNYVAVKHDISEHLQLAAQYQQAQKLESVGRLAGGVAHDYNNMLAVIMGYTEMALTKVGLSDALRADLEQIMRAARHSIDLTRQLLAFARKQTIVPRVLDLRETVGSMLKMLRRLIGEDIDLEWTPAPDLRPVKMDPAQVDQVLANLCVNARDAIAGVGKVTIEATNAVIDDAYCSKHPGFSPGEYVVLAVSDTGSGMDKETLEHIFEPFFTTKDMDRGTGLGLATVYGIVRQNNGFIHVYSEPGQGSTFKIYLPCHVGETVKVQRDGAEEIPQSHGETLLMVEDEPAMMKMGQKMLEKLGYRVLVASTPGEAIRLAEEHSKGIDLLITDVVMPQMNGKELAHLMKSLHPHLKVLFMSGYTANAIVHRGELEPGVHFIEKPFSLKDLAVKVRLAIEAEEMA